jgi:hypothetical protein
LRDGQGRVEYLQHSHYRVGHQHRLLILAPLLIGIVPDVATATPDPGPIGLALLAMAGGYAVSGRGPLWFDTLGASLGAVLALACSIPMRRHS